VGAPSRFSRTGDTSKPFVTILLRDVNCGKLTSKMSALHIDVYADVVSPWCFIGSRRLVTAREVNRLVHDSREVELTRQDVKDAARKGIRAVPVFVLNNRRVVTGAQAAAAIHAEIANEIEGDVDQADPGEHNHTPDEERQIRDAALDETIASTFPASDPPSSIPDPDDHNAGRN
jgi:hypothetical protein